MIVVASSADPKLNSKVPVGVYLLETELQTKIIIIVYINS